MDCFLLKCLTLHLSNRELRADVTAPGGLSFSRSPSPGPPASGWGAHPLPTPAQGRGRWRQELIADPRCRPAAPGRASLRGAPLIWLFGIVSLPRNAAPHPLSGPQRSSQKRLSNPLVSPLVLQPGGQAGWERESDRSLWESGIPNLGLCPQTSRILEDSRAPC